MFCRVLNSTTYHLTSTQDINTDILVAIKATYKSKPITIIVEVDEDDYELTTGRKNILYERLQEDEINYLSSEESLKRLNKKYDL